MLAITVLALGFPSQVVRASDSGIGKWKVVEVSSGTVILLNSEDGKTWVAAKKDDTLSWKKTEKE